jgi:tripartite-type tricarboxylate transporter receptor subunit TctC
MSINKKWTYAGFYALLLIAVAFAGVAIYRASGNDARGYPSKTVRVVVPYPPAGGTDILMRKVIEQVHKNTGWNVIIENVGGATGMIGARQVSASIPDGYTLLAGHVAPNGINPGDFLDPKQPADWKLDAVAMVAVAPSLLLVRPELNIKSVREFKLFLQTYPDTAFGSDGVGSLAHLQMELLRRDVAPNGLHVPYKGGGPALMGLMAGDVPMLFSPAPVALAHADSARFVVLAHTGATRMERLPLVPTMIESGEPTFDAPLWWGLFAPTGTPAGVVKLWHQAITDALADPEMRLWLLKSGYSERPMSVEQFAQFVTDEQRRWKR